MVDWGCPFHDNQYLGREHHFLSLKYINLMSELFLFRLTFIAKYILER